MLLYGLADAPDLVLVMLHHFEGLAVLSSELCVSCGHPRHAIMQKPSAASCFWTSLTTETTEIPIDSMLGNKVCPSWVSSQ